jgi:hypothetical protein
VPSRLRPGPLARDRHGTARYWRRLASCPSSPIERTKTLRTADGGAAPVTPAATQPAGNRPEHHPRQPGLPTARGPDQGNAGLPSPWRHWPAIATRNGPMLAPSSTHVRLYRSRERRPGRTADVRASPARATPAATWRTSATDTLTSHGNPDRQSVRCLAFALARWPAIAFQVRLEAGAVVAPRQP